MFASKITEKFHNISIRRQIFAVMIVSFLLMFAVLYAILYSSMGDMLRERENDDIKSQVSLVENALDDTYEYLPNVTRSWGAYDQMYNYVTGGFEEFLLYYLNDYPFKIYSLDFIAVLHPNGSIIYERFYEFSENNIKNKSLNLSQLYKQISPLTAALVEHNDAIGVNNSKEYSLSGFVNHGEKLLYLSSCPVLHTDRTGPVIGSVIFGRIVSEKEMYALNKNPNTKANILAKSELQLSEQDTMLLNAGNTIVNSHESSKLTAYSSFTDIFGNDSLLISVSGERHLYAEGIKNIQFAMLIVALCCTIIVFIILNLLNEIVIKPVKLYAKEVDNIKLDACELSISTATKYKEAKVLNLAINNMLLQIKLDRDIIHAKNQTLYYNANYDLLTGLKNRSNCRSCLKKDISFAQNNCTIVGVIMLDLDKFKNINDTMDHTVGDKFIVAISQRLEQELKQDVTITRFGGDEFVIILKNLKEVFKFHLYADCVMSLFKKPFTVGDREIYITVSMGTCIFPADGRDVDTLFKNAEIAMYHAKKLGGNIYCRYEKELNKVLQRKLLIENKIRTAINDGCKDFMPYFQPKALSDNGDIHSCEALIRWNVGNTVISPGEFIPLAEETGLIVPLSKWMLKESCRCNKIFQDNGIDHIVSVNISSQVLLHKDFLGMIKEAIDQSSLSLTKLDIELTEETLLEDIGKVINILNTLRDWGITTSIDDFGTGYSSLSYLKKLPVDRIKIDRSFIIGLNKNKDGDRPIVNAIVAMGKSLNKIITAEGVEDCAQYAYLKSIHCDEIQGYYVSKPLPCNDYMLFYNKWTLEKETHMMEIDQLL